MPTLIDTHTLVAILDTTAGPLILTDGPALAVDHITRGALFAAPSLAVDGDRRSIFKLNHDILGLIRSGHRIVGPGKNLFRRGVAGIF